jgi:predicted alpha/beta hydrolase family esterase
MTGMATVLIVPGLRDAVAQHWQTLLAAELPGAHSVPPMGRDDIDCAARVAALEAAAQAIDGPVLLVAHSGGCITVAHWARCTQRLVHAALLAAPPDFERRCPKATRHRTRWRLPAGCRSRAQRCPFAAWFAPAATTRWPASSAPSNWRTTGAASC